jgi:hypothetical protein
VFLDYLETAPITRELRQRIREELARDSGGCFSATRDRYEAADRALALVGLPRC